MDTYSRDIIQKEIDPQEKLLWASQPKQGVIFRAPDIFMIPFSVMWCGFAIFWEVTAATTDAPPEFLLFGSFFVIIGLYFVFGRFILDSFQRKKTYYGITDERIIILSGIFQKEIKSMNIRTLSDITLSEKTNGQGTITIGPSSFLESMYAGMPWPGMSQGSPKLEQIQEAKKVYNIIREQQND